MTEGHSVVLAGSTCAAANEFRYRAALTSTCSRLRASSAQASGQLLTPSADGPYAWAVCESCANAQT